MTFARIYLILCLCGCLLGIQFVAAQVPHPSDVFGFHPGDNYQLANYGQMLEYYRQLDASSDRVMMREIGSSVLGKPLLLLMISSKKNLKKIEQYRSASEQLARARIEEGVARKLASSGKAIVWIDGGLHATEVACAQMTTLLAHKVATEESEEMNNIRDNTIMLLMPVMNPDGLDIVADWYKTNRGTPYEMTRPPWLYHHYVGHDNNRDWFMNNMPESEAVTRILYNEWYPQIVYNHHQTGPSWTRIFVPPFADPVNPHIHPGVTTGVNMVGSSMANRFAIKEMPGVVSGVIYSMWWNGGMRTVPYFHNMIGILTETSHATPTPRFYSPDSIPKSIAARRGMGHPTDGTNIFYPYPWKGGESPFSDPVNYMLTASMAVLRTASDLKEQWLYNIYEMGRDAIEKGEKEGPFAYVISREQWNQGEERNLLNLLQLGGVEIHETTEPLTIGEQTYLRGSHIIYASQAFRPYVMDLLEKQSYPKRIRNGQPETPYDLAGWTLPMQMGVKVDRIDSAFTVRTSMIHGPLPIEGKSLPANSNAYFSLSHHANSSILAVNTLLANDISVHRVGKATDGLELGSFVIEAKSDAEQAQLATLARDHGIVFQAINVPLQSDLQAVEAARIGLYKSWVASMDEGWTRWLLKEYAFEVDTLHDADIQSTDLSQYDAILLPSQNPRSILNGHTTGTMPDAYVGGLGLKGTFALKRYVEQGGRIIGLDAASDYLIQQFGLPIRNVVSGVSTRQFFIPGSLIRMNIDTDHPLAFGMEAEAAASFVRSRAFKPIVLGNKGEGGVADLPPAPRPEVEIIARYAKHNLLMSGWAMGENQYLANKAAMVRIPLGQGDVVLFGFRPQFRGQPRGTYKLLFNSLLR
ncbi:MAG: M14 family metallopeptidase [Bacteroidota bacterium]